MHCKKCFFGMLILAVTALITTASSDKQALEPLRVGREMPKTNALTSPVSGVSFTLIHFWAAYDGESRAENVRWDTILKQPWASEIAYRAYSLDTNESVYRETLRFDGLASANQCRMPASERQSTINRYGLAQQLHTYLLNAKGCVVAVDPTPNDLRKFVGKVPVI